MAAFNNPLAFQDLFGRVHVEPSVTGLMLLQTVEPVRPGTFNDLILVSAFRSGAPGVLRRFGSLSALEDAHDPDGNADQGVALARTSKAPFGDDGMFGSADILTVRVGTPTSASTTVNNSSTSLFTITTADAGLHTNRHRRKLIAGTIANTKKLTLQDDKRVFIKDNLGPVLSLQYTGDASTALMTLRRTTCTIIYTAQPTDLDVITVNGVGFEFESVGGVTPPNVLVTIGASEDITFASLLTAIEANCPGVTGVLTVGTNTLVLTGADEVGVFGVETLDSGTVYTVANGGNAKYLTTTLAGDQSDGSADIGIPLTDPLFKTVDQLANYIQQQNGYTASVDQNNNNFIASTSIDPVVGSDIKSAAVTLYAYVATIVDWINVNTRGNYVAAIVEEGLEPDEDTVDVFFAGGNTPATTFAEWETALDLIASEIELGGILLLDTSDEAVMAAAVTFIQEQQTLGKFFRAYFGAGSHVGDAESLRIAQWLQLSGSLDSRRVRLTCQRMGVFVPGGTISYLAPIFLAAALAGGAAGNSPWINPLTNKRLRFAGIHIDDAFGVDTRESLLAGGITVVKKERDTLKVALHVTTSHDPDKRMPRVASEADTADTIDANMRQAFLQFRGKWAGSDIGARVFGVGTRVLEFFSSPQQGALVKGTDAVGASVPPWRFDNPAFTLDAGVLKLFYTVYMGGELNHISLLGKAEYQRIVGTLGGGQAEITTSVSAV